MFAQPHGLGNVGVGLVAQGPHLVEKFDGKTDLNAFRLNAVIQNCQEVGNRLVCPIGLGGKPEARVGGFLLFGLLNEIMHVLFE